MQLHNKKVDIPIRNEVITKAFIRATDRLDLKTKEITQLIGISPSNWSRVINHNRHIHLQTKEAEFTLLFLRIYRSLDALYGGNLERMKEWLRVENSHLQGVPIELIQSIEGLARVTTYLDAMRGLA